MQQVALKKIVPSPHQVRRPLKPASLQELAQSIREVGIIEPVIVRPVNGNFELVAGHRRAAAAEIAGLLEVPAIVRELDDRAALELLLIENLQRSDVHPLEEARGYQQLMKAKYDVAKIGERIGRSAKYVYDRLKLLQLTPIARDLFLEDKISAGHAILLARLSAKDQERALEVRHGGVFEHEDLLFDGTEEPVGSAGHDRHFGPLKAHSVRELQGWIDKHVRFDSKAPDPMLFPDTVQALEGAKKIIPITHENYIPPEAREGRTWGPRSWKRADGKGKSKTCEHSVTGFVAVGAGRGDAFPVCVAKEKCAVHWGAEKRERDRRAAARERPETSAAAARAAKQESRWEAERKREVELHNRQVQQRGRWERAKPAILKALAERVKKASTVSNGPLGKILVRAVSGWGTPRSALELVPRGKDAEDLVRYAAFVVLAREASGHMGFERFPKMAKEIGLAELGKIVDAAAPVQTSAKPRKRGTKAKR